MEKGGHELKKYRRSSEAWGWPLGNNQQGNAELSITHELNNSTNNLNDQENRIYSRAHQRSDIQNGTIIHL